MALSFSRTGASAAGGGFDFTKLYSTGASATSSMPPKVALHNAETNEAKLEYPVDMTKANNYSFYALAVDKVGDWDGRAPLHMSVRADSTPADTFPQDTRHAILAQELGRGQDVTGPILAAIRLD